MTNHHPDHRPADPGELVAGPERHAPAASARPLGRSTDGSFDPGDHHDKGEPSLCVGEAA